VPRGSEEEEEEENVKERLDLQFAYTNATESVGQGVQSPKKKNLVQRFVKTYGTSSYRANIYAYICRHISYIGKSIYYANGAEDRRRRY
jgi:hypothetical protein